MARPLVGGRGAHGDHRHSAERERRVGSFRGGKPALSEPRARSDDPRADRANGDVVLSLRPGERRGGRDALDLGIEAGCDRRGPRNQPPLEQCAHGVRERDRQRSTGELHVGDAQAAEYYKAFEQQEELAMFLRKLEILEETLQEKATVVLGPDTQPFDLLKGEEALPLGTEREPAAPSSPPTSGERSPET